MLLCTVLETHDLEQVALKREEAIVIAENKGFKLGCSGHGMERIKSKIYEVENFNACFGDMHTFILYR